jgi:hypothetical protein
LPPVPVGVLVVEPPPPPHEQSATDARTPNSFTSADLYGHATRIFANSMPDSQKEAGSIACYAATVLVPREPRTKLSASLLPSSTQNPNRASACSTRIRMGSDFMGNARQKSSRVSVLFRSRTLAAQAAARVRSPFNSWAAVAIIAIRT